MILSNSANMVRRARSGEAPARGSTGVDVGLRLTLQGEAGRVRDELLGERADTPTLRWLPGEE